MRLQGLAIAWMREQDWPAWLAIDPNFQPDYRIWLQRMDATYARYQAAGVPVIKVEIRPQEFAEWCRATGRTVSSDARAAFAALKARQQHQGQERT